MNEYEKLADLVYYVSRDAEFLNSDVVTDEMTEEQRKHWVNSND